MTPLLVFVAVLFLAGVVLGVALHRRYVRRRMLRVLRQIHFVDRSVPPEVVFEVPKQEVHLHRGTDGRWRVAQGRN